MNAPKQGLPGSGTPENPRPGMPLEQRARELHREACQRIDPVTAGRLRAARRQALAAPTHAAHRATRWLLPTGAFAALALAALMVWQPQQRHVDVSQEQAAGVAQVTVDTDSELPPDADKVDPNLYQNLDFYGWLAANGGQNAPAAAH